jgi:hypothetical protein
MSILTVTRTWHDGYVDTLTLEWPGYTATEGCANRLHRLREAHADVTRHDATSLTLRTVRTIPELNVVEHMRWDDTDTQPTLEEA